MLFDESLHKLLLLYCIKNNTVKSLKYRSNQAYLFRIKVVFNAFVEAGIVIILYK